MEVWALQHRPGGSDPRELVAIAATREAALAERMRIRRDSPEAFPGFLVVRRWGVIAPGEESIRDAECSHCLHDKSLHYGGADGSCMDTGEHGDAECSCKWFQPAGLTVALSAEHWQTVLDALGDKAEQVGESAEVPDPDLVAAAAEYGEVAGSIEAQLRESAGWAP